MHIQAGYLARAAAGQFASRVALTSVSGDDITAVQTFEHVNEAANRIGSGLIALGVRRGDRVGVLSYNLPEVFAAWLGFEKHHLVRVGLHSHLGMDAHVRCLNHVGATAILFDTRFTREIDARRGDFETVRHFIAMGPHPPQWAIPYDEVAAHGDPAEPTITVDEDAPCFLQVTSGTTAEPKPWIKTYRSWHAVIAHNLVHFDTFGSGIPPIGSDDVNLHFNPLQWATGFQTLYPYFIRGARSVLVDDETFDAAQVVDTIVREHVTGTFAPSSLWKPILQEIRRRGGIDHRLRRVVITFCSPELLDETTAMIGPVWAHGFGSTEQGAVTTRLLPRDLVSHPHRRTSVGRPASPFLEVAIKDEAGQDVPANRSGLICVRSPMSIGSYWARPELSADARFPADWFRSSDVGYLDEDGFLFYRGRSEDAIVTAAGAVYPHAIEVAIARHPAVSNCAVVGIGDDGVAVPVAAVQVAPGYQAGDELAAAILAGLEGELPEHEVPARVEFLDTLPTVLGGAKVQRSVLREQLSAS